MRLYIHTVLLRLISLHTVSILEWNEYFLWYSVAVKRWARDWRVEPRISDQKSWIKILSYAKSRKPFGIFSFDANSEHGNVPNRKTYFVGKKRTNRVTSCLGGKKVSVFKLPNDIYFHLKWKRLDVMKVLF